MTLIKTLLTTLLTPPTFADEDKTRTARLLHTYLQLNIGLNLLSVLISLVFAPYMAWFPLAVIALTVGIQHSWLRQGRFTPIGILGLVVMALVFYVSNFVAHEIYGPGTAFCLVLLVAGAFVYGEKGLMVTFVITAGLIVFGAMFYYPRMGSPPAQHLFLYDTVVYLFIFSVTTITVAVSLQALNHALKRVRTSERALKDANTDLERRIHERTEQLAQSESHYRSLIENTSDMVSIVWPNGEVVYQSPSLEFMLGYKPQDVVGLNVFDVVHPDDVTSTQNALMSLTESNLPSRVFEARFRHLNGHWVHLEMTGKMIRDGQQTGSIVMSSRNITERKQAEQIIQRQAESERLVSEISERFTRMAAGKMDETINTTMQRVGEFVGVDICRLFLLDEDGVQLTNTHEWCAPGIASALMLMQHVPFYQQYGWWNQQLRAYKVIHMASLDEFPPESKMDDFLANLRTRGVKSLVTVPLMRGGNLLGEIGFDAMQHEKTWSVEDIRLLRVVSEMIVSVLERERIAAALHTERNLLEQRVQERTLELSKLLDASHAIRSTLQLQPLLNQVLQAITEVVPYNTAAISEFTQFLDMRILAYKGWVPDHELVREWRYDPDNDLHIFELMQTRGPVIVNDSQADTLFAKAIRARYQRTVGKMDEAVVSLIYIPLVARDALVGMLTLTSNLPNQYGTAHARLAMTFANQAAVAIENARLHEGEVQAAALAERSRLARELHDSVSQSLFGIVLGSRTIIQKAEGMNALAEPTNYVLRLAEASLAEMRALIFELRPESLQEEGLIVAFQRQAEALCARHQIAVNTHLGEVEPELPIEAKEALYRIGLEAIQNTIKHAQATHVALTMQVDEHRVLLEVCDDGIGFDVTSAHPGHLGLISMRERAEKCDGRFDVRSNPGHGTQVCVQLPAKCACR